MSDIGHNSEQAAYERQVFMRGFNDLRAKGAKLAGIRGEMGGVYDRLKNIGFTKADVKWAEELEDKDASEIIATMRRRLKIAEYFGHGVSRQMNLFDEDRAPIEESAYSEGFAAGMLRKPMGDNPHDLSTKAGQAWQKGHNEGSEQINADLKSVIEEADAAPLDNEGDD